ncbi:hypothetical protein [Prevotella sp.]|uniref:hypothetical protein n=1 Tax=Prevotella sp. TaxID=59823 RepID=UPI0025FD6B1A|nr:hypothetical protein [Prevotella sp.]
MGNRPARNSTFYLPCRKRLWKALGEYDALVEYMELTTRKFKTLYNSQHELSFSEFLSKEAKSEDICLNNLTLENYECFKYKYYLILPYSAFDRFLDDFRKDFKLLFDKDVPLPQNKTRFQSILDFLKENFFAVQTDSFSYKLFDYYRLCRNSLAHDSLKKTTEIEAIFHAIKVDDVHLRYPNLDAPNDMKNLNFDDFILCTANIKSIADKLVLCLEDKMNWVDFVKRNSKLFSKLNRFKGNKERQVIYIENVIFSMYGIKLSAPYINDILEIFPIE